MTDFVKQFRDEIARVAKREIRRELDPVKRQLKNVRTEVSALKKVSASQNSEINRLKKTTAQLEKDANLHRAASLYLKSEVDRLSGEVERLKAGPVVEEDHTKHRYSTRMLVGFATKHGLHAPQIAKLLDGSPAAAYRWLDGLRPRQKYIDNFHKVRTLSKREVADLLAV